MTLPSRASDSGVELTLSKGIQWSSWTDRSKRERVQFEGRAKGKEGSESTFSNRSVSAQISGK